MNETNTAEIAAQDALSAAALRRCMGCATAEDMVLCLEADIVALREKNDQLKSQVKEAYKTLTDVAFVVGRAETEVMYAVQKTAGKNSEEA